MACTFRSRWLLPLLLAPALACSGGEDAPAPEAPARPSPVTGEHLETTPALPLEPAAAAAAWQGRIEGALLVLEARSAPGGGWLLATPEASAWQLRRHRREGGTEVLDLRLGEGLTARDLRLRLVLRPEAATLEGEALAGIRRLTVRLTRR